MVGRIVYTYWEARTFRCVLVATRGPSLYAVNVLRDDPELGVTTTVVTQSCDDIDEGDGIARQFWQRLIVEAD